MHHDAPPTAALSSFLDDPPEEFRDQPFYEETLTLLRCVRDRDFDTLADLCDDDFGIVDVDPSGAARPVRDRAGWEEWFRGLFATLETMGADTDSIVLDYRALESGALGYGVLEFEQTLTLGPHTARFQCVATIIWKLTPQGWRESRWHASVISSQVPAELQSVTS